MLSVDMVQSSSQAPGPFLLFSYSLCERPAALTQASTNPHVADLFRPRLLGFEHPKFGEMSVRSWPLGAEARRERVHADG